MSLICRVFSDISERNALLIDDSVNNGHGVQVGLCLTCHFTGFQRNIHGDRGINICMGGKM